jgi:UDP-hydrolysing UDP-N-acetyl-D-glucosamine 2-epimerase
MRKICVVIGNRANYSSIKSALLSIKKHPFLKLQIVTFASALIKKYGLINDTIKSDGFKIDGSIFNLVEGESPITMAKTTGLGLIELPTMFDKLKPDIVFTIGDRFETMATAVAAAYMNIPLAHSMGGEVTGTIDESIRHAITKLAHIHFPASRDAYNRIIKLGEQKKNVFLVGCPRIDLISQILSKINKFETKKILIEGIGAQINLNEKFILVSQHPVTTEYGMGEFQINETLKAIHDIDLPTLFLWPNPDAGSEDISRGIRKWREKGKKDKITFIKNVHISTYIYLMKKTSCLIGNSSSGIREGSFIGTPVVNIGTRQNSREKGTNVIDVNYKSENILKAIKKQIKIGQYKKKKIYGNGDAGKKIANILSTCNLNVQKKISF